MLEVIGDRATFPKESNSRVQPSENALQRGLDAIEILHITLEDAESYFWKRDLCSTLQQVEMCYRFIENAFWYDRSGVIERILLKLVTIHVNLTNGTPIWIDPFCRDDWEGVLNVLTSAESVENLKQRLLEKDVLSLKLVVFDRIKELLICGPIDFSIDATQKLLERLELCLRYLPDEDSDFGAISIIISDIRNIVSLVESYEVMEFWETINFQKWFVGSTFSSESHSEMLESEHRKVYKAAEIFREKVQFEDRWREIFKSTHHDFAPPKMVACYPDHPYSAYFKKNQNRFALYLPDNGYCDHAGELVTAAQADSRNCNTNTGDDSQNCNTNTGDEGSDMDISFERCENHGEQLNLMADSQADETQNFDQIRAGDSDKEVLGSLTHSLDHRGHTEAGSESIKVVIGRSTTNKTVNHISSPDSLSSDSSSDISASFSLSPDVGEQLSTCLLPTSSPINLSFSPLLSPPLPLPMPCLNSNSITALTPLPSTGPLLPPPPPHATGPLLPPPPLLPEYRNPTLDPLYYSAPLLSPSAFIFPPQFTILAP